MIKLEDIPQTGILILNVYFEGYKDNYANDSRRKLEKTIPKIGEDDIEIRLTPIQFSLIRTIAHGISRAIGTQYQYGYSQMTPEKFEKLYKEIGNIKLNWWKSFEIIVGNYVEGFE